VKTVWTLMLGIYVLTLLPAGFLAIAAFAQTNVDQSGDARNAAITFGAYLIGFPLLLLVTKPRGVFQRGRDVQ
jgi:hypothetical protein